LEDGIGGAAQGDAILLIWCYVIELQLEEGQCEFGDGVRASAMRGSGQVSQAIVDGIKGDLCHAVLS
jgi:hypothetical protein